MRFNVNVKATGRKKPVERQTRAPIVKETTIKKDTKPRGRNGSRLRPQDVVGLRPRGHAGKTDREKIERVSGRVPIGEQYWNQSREVHRQDASSEKPNFTF